MTQSKELYYTIQEVVRHNPRSCTTLTLNDIAVVILLRARMLDV